jgi:hypothetical protein
LLRGRRRVPGISPEPGPGTSLGWVRGLLDYEDLWVPEKLENKPYCSMIPRKPKVTRYIGKAKNSIMRIQEFKETSYE